MDRCPYPSLSDAESWCNSITEAKILGVPVVVTNFESSYEQVEDGINGIIVPLDLDNYDNIVNRIITEQSLLKKNLKDFKYELEVDKWNEVLNN